MSHGGARQKTAAQVPALKAVTAAMKGDHTACVISASDSE